MWSFAISWYCPAATWMLGQSRMDWQKTNSWIKVRYRWKYKRIKTYIQFRSSIQFSIFIVIIVFPQARIFKSRRNTFNKERIVQLVQTQSKPLLIVRQSSQGLSIVQDILKILLNLNQPRSHIAGQWISNSFYFHLIDCDSKVLLSPGIGYFFIDQALYQQLDAHEHKTAYYNCTCCSVRSSCISCTNSDWNGSTSGELTSVFHHCCNWDTLLFSSLSIPWLSILT